MRLYIGNKTYSSWSMRPWVLMRALDIDFEDVFVPFDGFTPEAEFKKTMAAIHPMATVPVLEAHGLVIGDSLAITEYLAEAFPEAGIWPSERTKRAKARQITSVMHSGFSALRTYCPMNIGVDLAPIGQKLMAEQGGLRADLALLEALLGPHCAKDGYLFGDFSAADAFYAPVMSRIESYDLPLSEALSAYQKRLLSHKAVKAWVAEAKAEGIFLDFEEPYRDAPDGAPFIKA
ncbi:MAG: glutathione S-transferase family protein [Candidatus Puniceispirillaceae bacterium]